MNRKFHLAVKGDSTLSNCSKKNDDDEDDDGEEDDDDKDEDDEDDVGDDDDDDEDDNNVDVFHRETRKHSAGLTLLQSYREG